VRTASILARRAASLAFAICSRNALDELATFGDCSPGSSLTSGLREALAFAICSRSATDELETFRDVSGVLLVGVWDGVVGVAAGGDAA